MNQTGIYTRAGATFVLVAGIFFLSACTPTVAVQAPSEPITVNLNVKIEHEIRVKVDKELDDLFEDKDGIF
ncbi:YnbE family lipoprotein [Microbulbifer bruguierae]|uniref:YnbE family lipoprotein n=1 Tax=Microbulbifer bruguierae TaxID=3029061 RepID=A0ABY8NFA6_9GAMM|nr:YnbE family lipoprotein [Microbulbifer bruguierae]